MYQIVDISFQTQENISNLVFFSGERRIHISNFTQTCTELYPHHIYLTKSGKFQEILLSWFWNICFCILLNLILRTAVEQWNANMLLHQLMYLGTVCYRKSNRKIAGLLKFRETYSKTLQIFQVADLKRIIGKERAQIVSETQPSVLRAPKGGLTSLGLCKILKMCFI